MKYGICPLSVVPMRLEPSDRSEMVNQILYGETFKVITERKKWCKVRLAHDKYEGWIDQLQWKEINKEDYQSINSLPKQFLQDNFGMAVHFNQSVSSLSLGAQVSSADLLQDQIETATSPTKNKIVKSQIVDLAVGLLNTSYLWGGRSPLGIDCSGFTQLIYRLAGVSLLRDASQQATQGEALSFIEESSPGDLAFFDNEEGFITHVGIIMQDNHIIHAHGQVRIDLLDQSGIYNVERNTHTHKLRVIKSIF